MNCDFIEIGTSNFDTLIQTCSDDQVGLSVEPLENYLDDLPDKPHVIKVPLAISNQEGELDMYYVPPDVVDQYFPGQNGLKGCSSLISPHPTATRIMNEKGIGHLIKTTKVPVITFGQLIEKYEVQSIKYLKVDTEGHDPVILNSMVDYFETKGISNNSPLWPDKILFESNSLNNYLVVEDVIARLSHYNYRVKVKTDTDTTLVRMDSDLPVYRILVLSYDLTESGKWSRGKRLLQIIDELSEVKDVNLEIRTCSYKLAVPIASKFFGPELGPDLIITQQFAIEQGKILSKTLDVPLAIIINNNTGEYYQFFKDDSPDLVCCLTQDLKDNLSSPAPSMVIDSDWLNDNSPFWDLLLRKISIIVPCHGRHIGNLDRLISNFEDFTSSPYEVIISVSSAPGQSIEQTGKILSELKAKSKLKVKFHLSLQPLTASQNRNLAAQQAKGDILVFLDADDKYHVQLIEIVKDIWRKHSPTDLHWQQYVQFSQNVDYYTQKRYDLDQLQIISPEEVYNYHFHGEKPYYRYWTWEGETEMDPPVSKAHSAVSKTIWKTYPWPEIIHMEDRMYNHRMVWDYPESCLWVKAVLSIYQVENSLNLNNQSEFKLDGRPLTLVDKLGREWKYYPNQDIPYYDIHQFPNLSVQELLDLASQFPICKSFNTGGWLKHTRNFDKLKSHNFVGHGIYVLQEKDYQIGETVGDEIPPIERIIHQIWIGPKEKPTCYMDTYSKDFMAAHPDWKYMFWGDKEIEELDMPDNMREIYEKEPQYCGKADIARIYILYKYGGLYIDADCVWVNEKNYDELIWQSKDTGLFIGCEDHEQFVANGFIGVGKKNAQVKYMMDKVVQNYGLRKYCDPWKSIGPLLWNLLPEEGRPITKFPSKYFYPVRWHRLKDPQHHEKIDLPKESYSFHYGITTTNLNYQVLLK